MKMIENIYRYDKHNSNSISDNIIFSIAEDQQGNIWIGTETD